MKSMELPSGQGACGLLIGLHDVKADDFPYAIKDQLIKSAVNQGSQESLPHAEANAERRGQSRTPNAEPNPQAETIEWLVDSWRTIFDSWLLERRSRI